MGGVPSPGGIVGEWRGDLGYAGIGVLDCLIAGSFLAFSPLGHAEDDLPRTPVNIL